MSFQNKYIKYKTKYQLLKNQRGGGSVKIIFNDNKYIELSKDELNSFINILNKTDDIYNDLFSSDEFKNVTIDKSNIISNIIRNIEQINNRLKAFKDIKESISIYFSDNETNTYMTYILPLYKHGGTDAEIKQFTPK